MPRILSIFPDSLHYLNSAEGMALHGANLATAAILQRFIADERLNALEVFVPPYELTDQAELARIAEAFLPPHRRGQGALRFYPLHFVPEVWADGRSPEISRAIFCIDPRFMTAQRYARDRYAVGPTPLLCDVHSIVDQPFWAGLAPLARAENVPFDAIVCRANDSVEAFRRGFGWLRTEQGLSPGSLPCPLEMVPHAVDTDHFRPAPPGLKLAARKTLGWPERANIALYLGRVTPYSKADLLPLLASWRRVSTPNDHLIIAGEPYPAGYTDLLRDNIARLNLEDRVTLVGKVAPSERLNFYQAADCFVFPADSVVDTGPNTVLEAAACGLPVIVSGWTSTRERVLHGESGFIIPTRRFPGTGRIDAFSPLTPRTFDWLALGQNLIVDGCILDDALEQLLGDELLRANMGATGRQHTEAHYSWSVVMDQWFALWDRLDAVARREHCASAARRKTHAGSLGFPVPYGSIAGHYADETVDIRRERICLSETGQQLLRGRGEFSIYQDLTPLVRRETLEATLHILTAAQRLTPHQLALEVTGANPQIQTDDVLFLLGILLKHGMLMLLPPVL